MDNELNTDVAVDPQGTETETVEQNTENEVKTFKQEDVNNIVSRESKKATEKLLKDLGIDDFENAKDGLEKFKEWQESQKTEADKQAEQLTKANEQVTSLEAQNAQLKAENAALGQGVDSDSLKDVIALANTYVSEEVDINKAIETVLEKYPNFKGESIIQPSGQSVVPGNPKRSNNEVEDPFKKKLEKYKN